MVTRFGKVSGDLAAHEKQAEEAFRTVSHVLSQELGLAVPTERVLTHVQEHPVLFCVMDAQNLGTSISKYQRVAHQLSTALGGLPVHISNTSGLRYAIFLNGEPDLPTDVPFPGYLPDFIRLGVDKMGREVAVPIGDFGHWLISGMTRYGKSSFARLITAQLIHNNHELIVIDEQNVTIPQARYYSGCKMFLRDISDISSAILFIENEYALRVSKFDELERKNIYVEKLSEYNNLSNSASLPRIFIIIEEYNDIFTSADTTTRDKLVNLVRKSGKYGLHFILIAQDWTKESVGPIRSQLGNIISFRLDRASQSRVTLGRKGAEALLVPGRALSNNWDEIQTFYLSKEEFTRLVPQNNRSINTPPSAIQSGSGIRTGVPEPGQNTISDIQNRAFDSDRTKIETMLLWGFAHNRIARALGGNYQNRLQQIKAISKK
jgi:hypothetical protein